MVTVSRVMLFEKFTAVFFFFYLLFILSLAFILSVLHWVVAVIIMLLGVALFVKTLHGFEFLKRALIRKNDRIEYADPNAADSKDIFKTATVLLKMRPEEVRKTKLISDELIGESTHFYLVKADDEPTVISYDWIMGLSPEILEMEFED